MRVLSSERVSVVKKSQHMTGKSYAGAVKSSIQKSLSFGSFTMPATRSKSRKPERSPRHVATKESTLKVGLWNARSLANKTELVNDYMHEKNIDIFLMTESWLKHSNVIEIIELENCGEFCFVHNPRERRKGGGVACLHNSSFNVLKSKDLNTKSFEFLEIAVDIRGKSITFGVLYRPEPSKKNHYNMNDFFDELSNLLLHYIVDNKNFILVGDFNIHVNDPND